MCDLKQLKLEREGMVDLKKNELIYVKIEFPLSILYLIVLYFRERFQCIINKTLVIPFGLTWSLSEENNLRIYKQHIIKEINQSEKIFKTKTI